MRVQLTTALGALVGLTQATTTPPDLRLVFVNQCQYPVRFTWDQNIGGSAPSVLLLYNDKVAVGGTIEVNVPTVSWTGGRIYVSHYLDGDGGQSTPAVPAAQLQGVLTLIANQAISTVKSSYADFLLAGEPRVSSGSIAPPGQLIEFTVVKSGTQKLYDADISNVFYFSEAVNVDMMYENGYGKVDPTNCRNTSNKVSPDQAGCQGGGGFWIQYPATTAGGPGGQCKSPNLECMHNSSQPICNRFNKELGPLFRLLEANENATGYMPQLPSLSDTSKLYTCDGMADSPSKGFMLAAMCAALNRGQCAMPSTSDLASVTSFQTWVKTSCGLKQFYAPDTSGWFKQVVYNPWAKYIRNDLGSSAYAFAQDEGPLGGNVQCRSDDGMGWEAPTGMKVTTCPGAAPVPQKTCNVGDVVNCPGSSVKCAGSQCCPDGSTCPSASIDFKACLQGKTVDCTQQVQHCNVGDVVPCPGGKTGNCMGDQCCQDGSTCPSADVDFKGCAKPKTVDCTAALSGSWNRTSSVFV